MHSKFKPQTLLSLLKSHQTTPVFHHHQYRTITKVRLKWVKNKFIDHLIQNHTHLKAAMLLKDAIKLSPSFFITSKTIQHWHKPLGLTFPVLRFLRRYPTLFHEFPHSRYPSLPCFNLTDLALSLDRQEQLINLNNESFIVETLCRLLMMMKSGSVSLRNLYPLRWDLGLPLGFEKWVAEKYPDYIRVCDGGDGLPCLKLVQWRDEFAISALQKGCDCSCDDDYWDFKRGKMLGFPMNFPKGYGYQSKVRVWMEEFHKLPYVSPYDDYSLRLDPKSELMEKRNVGLLHEFLSLTVYKKTKRNYLRSLREELSLPHRFTRIFTRYPGIFYLSLKCKTTTVTLKEGYKKGRLVDPHPLAPVRDKFYHVMRTGLLYRGKGVKHLSIQDCLIDDNAEDENDGDFDDDENQGEEECWEKDVSGSDEDSD